MNYRITEFYIEPGITGTHGNRPEFIRLQHNISCKNHSFVIFKEIARLVRDLEIWKRFFRLCQSHDCEICIRGLPFNPNDPASILQLDQLAAFAEFESRTTSKRIRESNHSALVTSGKFNSHYPLLGFDALKNEREEYTGIYKPNRAELRQVEWVMATFLRVDRYKVLLDLCKSRGIKSKRGKDFNKNNIRSLLTNPRYIGKWYRNKHNADKRQNKLMPYERFTEVELDHGCVIDKELWQRVQDKIKELDESRAQATKHCYPLSGLLVFSDGSSFAGSSAWGKTKRSTYYHNKPNKIRVRSEVFEAETEKILRQVAENAPEFQRSIADYAARKENSIGIVAKKITEIDVQLDKVDTERKSLDKRLNFLLDDDDLAMAQSFRGEYKRRFSALNDEEQELECKKSQLQLLLKQLRETQETTRSARGGSLPLSSSHSWLEHVNEALGHLKKKDMMSLRSTYRRIFDKIIVRRLDAAKVRLQFVFKNITSPSYMGEVANCVSAGLVEAVGIEPTSKYPPAEALHA